VDTARYVVGCLLVAGLPPGLGYWFVIHPFVDHWRRFGVRRTFWLVGALSVLAVYGLFRVRDALLMAIGVSRRRQLTFHRLSGAPELDPSGKGGELLTEGLYAMSRNPRYIEVVAGSFAYACFSNYVGAYVIAFASLPLLHLVVLFEERELRERFGEPYEAYFARVPRYIPLRRPAS
jgi:steroid 5-alpha reductase family enzyme